MTYTDEATGRIRKCQDGNPRPASRHRAGAYVCQACWPSVQDRLLADYDGSGLMSKKGYSRALGLQALERTFRRVN